ncbi:MAG TPA: sulfide/dihydroorotate dehydrogenase-like FAD/NAD-binding protein [Thermodesulfobacteriota bacterium]|nr:sulfide/dihydroorotate dehydrogenase-like FAD/NAD-binding protein [Thermodesulfobacteriota bacterium]
MFEIVEKRHLAHMVNLFSIKAPLIAKKRKAGQFVVLRLNEHGERIPLTIADSNPDEGTISIVVQEVGKTTALLSNMDKGGFIMDVVGPLGKPTHIENYGTAVCVGGGIGTAVTYPIGKALKEAGCEVISIIGSRTKDLLIMESEMRSTSSELLITTDDGTYGYHGFVTAVLSEMIAKAKKIDIVFAIGPVPMMRAVSELTRPHGILTMVSLNPIMVDGTGMCGSCRVTIGGKNRFVCVDGPEFDGHEVDFPELIRRNRSYLKEERMAMEEFVYHEGATCCERKET